MKILIGMPDKNSWGGPKACEPPFVEALRCAGLTVKEETYVFGDRTFKTPVYQRIRRVIRGVFIFRRELANESIDLVHLNTSFDSKAVLRDAVTLTFLTKRPVKIFLKFHGSDQNLLKTSSKLKRFLWNFLLHRADGIGVLSSEEMRNFLDAGVPKEKVFVVKNVVSLGIQETTKRSESTIPRLLFVSRFIETKGLLDVIRACAILSKKNFSFRLKCVGDGEMRKEAEEEVLRSNLQGVVVFTGYVSESEVQNYFFASDVLLFPSYHIEGFPMVIFNAAAAGLPIITTRIRAAADYMKEPENCFWVEPKNPEQLAEKIIALFEDAATRNQMSVNNLELSKQFRADRVAHEYVEIYRELIARH